METLQRVLAEHPFLQGLEERLLAPLTGCAANVRFEAGQMIFREGEEANQFYLVREGKLRDRTVRRRTRRAHNSDGRIGRGLRLVKAGSAVSLEV